jgi:hypothetical protein
MSARYNNGSHYENHQRERELQDGPEHAHRAAELHGKQEHLTGHEQTRQSLEYNLHPPAAGSHRPEFGHDDIAALAQEL